MGWETNHFEAGGSFKGAVDVVVVIFTAAGLVEVCGEATVEVALSGQEIGVAKSGANFGIEFRHAVYRSDIRLEIPALGQSPSL